MALIRKTERVVFVATKSQLAGWRLCADETGLSLSEWLRTAAASAVRPARRDSLPRPTVLVEQMVK